MTNHLRRRLTVLFVLLAGLAAAVAPTVGQAVGEDAGGDTSAVAINTRDGSSVFRLAFQIRRVTGDVVDNQNAAVAYASCNECQTVAVSIQVLLIAGSPTVFAPENVALAINEQCTLCDTMALAYQFAVGMETKLKFTAEGSRRLADLRRQLEQLRNSGLSIEEIQARASEIMDQLSTVLSSELVGVVGPEETAPPDGTQQADPSGGGTQTTTEPQPTGEPAPSEPTETAPAEDPTETPATTDPTQTTPQPGDPQASPPASTTPAP